MFASKDGKVRIECRFESDTLWLSQATICELYGKAKATISGHIKNIFDEGELVEIQLFGFTEALLNKSNFC
ncbi:toxin-antitoxin system, toxin component, Fic family [Enterobacter roggenkampii]|nr:toxin-antitoxin system, toxin component, Fic family [Enterobacter roggenkampii]